MVYASSSTSYPQFGTTPRNPLPANPTFQGPREEGSCSCHDCLQCLGVSVFYSVIGILPFMFLAHFLYSSSVGYLPVVRIDYIDVSLRNDSINPGNMMMSDWDVVFTVENQLQQHTLVYGDFNVSIHYDAGISTVGIVPGPGLQQNPSDVAKFNTTVQALLAPHNATNYEVRFGVNFLSEVITLASTFSKKTTRLFNGTCANMTLTVEGTHGSVGGIVKCLDPTEFY